MIERVKSLLNGSNVLKNGFWSVAGTFLVRAINLISIPIFSRMMTTGEYGLANVFLTYVNIFMILEGLDFNGAVSKGYFEFKGKDRPYAGSNMIFCLGWFVIFLLIFNVFSNGFGNLLDMSRLEMNILVVYSFFMFVVTYASTEYIIRLQYKMNMALSSAVAAGNVVLSIVFMATIFRNNLYLGRILGASIPTAAIGVALVVRYIVRGKRQFRWEYIKFSLKMGVPLIPHNLSHLILSSADKIMIASMIGDSESGIYSLVYTLGMILVVFLEAIDYVWMPWLYRRLEDKSFDVIYSRSKIYILLFAAISIVIACISPEVVKILSPRSYWGGINFVVWIVFSVYLMFMYRLYVNVEFYYKKTYLISIGTVMAAVVNIVLNLLFLNRFGYGFAAISTVISYALLYVFHFIIVKFVLKKDVMASKWVALSGVIIFAIFFGINMIVNIVVARYIIVALLLAICLWFGFKYLNKREMGLVGK